MSEQGTLAPYTRVAFEHDGDSKPVWRRDRPGAPTILVICEIPGITPEVIGFADLVFEQGYAVWLPELFGTPGAPRSLGGMASSVARACISREFDVLASNRTSPVVGWLRALARAADAESDGAGVGVVGMCLTGNFALGMVMEPCVKAPVLSQPSLPFVVSPWHAAAVHASEEDLAAARARHAEDGFTVLGLRFAHDMLCPAARFRTLERTLGPAFESVTCPSTGHGARPWHHSVLTNDRRPSGPTAEALQRVFAHFARHLLPPT